MNKPIPSKLPDEANKSVSDSLLNLAFTKINSIEKQIASEKNSKIELMKNMAKMAQAISQIIIFVESLQSAYAVEENGKSQDIKKIINEFNINLSLN